VTNEPKDEHEERDSAISVPSECDEISSYWSGRGGPFVLFVFLFIVVFAFFHTICTPANHYEITAPTYSTYHCDDSLHEGEITAFHNHGELGYGSGCHSVWKPHVAHEHESLGRVNGCEKRMYKGELTSFHRHGKPWNLDEWYPCHSRYTSHVEQEDLGTAVGCEPREAKTTPSHRHAEADYCHSIYKSHTENSSRMDPHVWD